MDIVSQAHTDLSKLAETEAPKYQSASPFDHGVFHNFFNPAFLQSVLDEFPDLNKTDAAKFDNKNERKLAGKGERHFGPNTTRLMHFLNSEPFLLFLQKLTGIEEVLMPDPYFVGGGFHEIKPGGYLKIHADFNRHNLTGLDRRINALVYLNQDWDESYGGHFELWDKDMTKCHKKVLPVFNTLAIFSTTDFSYHGHPDPLTCPEGRSRKSLALYYYSNGRPQHEISEKDHTTVFKARDEKEELASEGGLKAVLKDFVPPVIIKAAKALRK